MRFQDSVEALVESFAQMASAIEGRDVDLAIGVAGIVVGLVGLLITIETGGTGVGLVVGIVVTVVGLVLTIWGVVRVLTVVPARRDAMIKELSANADSVTSDPWPAGPRLTDEDW
ncbi:hypothetical protein [uncultured Tessaracoccus sp.]|uniref:hypothetical protein n=1 Tax=uncultured Tessaracoccus sp. TaxID=905023 RepID=UPI0025F73C8A|nr:hypothetical protein [uncultured Tessaracoccus sp.]